MTYRDLAARCAPLDERTTRYRFDLEADVAWKAIDAPGLHVGPALLSLLGLDPALTKDALFQWGAALALCQAFHDLERLILRFAQDEAPALSGTRSLGLLVEEEEKHLLLFERYAARLRMARPKLAAQLEADLAATEGLLGDLAEEDAPSRHYLFWLNTLFFEELTVLLDDALRQDGAEIQPCWASLHAAHRREEVQHVVTDVAHLEALDLDEARRAALSKRFLFRLERGFDRFFGLEAVARVAPAVQLGRDLRGTPLFARLLSGPAFRRTREAAPYVAALAGGRVSATARVEGPALVVAPPADLPAALRRAAATRPDAGVTWISDDGGAEEHEPYPALLARAARLGAGLRRRGARPGDRVLLLLPTPRDLVGVLWGALLEGLVPAPVGLGGGEDDERLRGIHARLGERTLVVASPDVALPEAWPRVSLEELDGADETPSTHAPRPDDPVFVQFSSGSTGAPRGVVLTHANVLADLQGAIERQGVTRDDVVVSWMPLHHDMGLGLHLTPLLACAPQVLLPTALFARRPARWLRALSDHRATVGAAANFALALTTRRLGGRTPSDPLASLELDLSTVRCLLVGAEPISADVLERFAARLAPSGLRRAALCPAYGLAEATVAVSFGHALEGPRVVSFARASLESPDGAVEVDRAHPGAATFVELGPPLPGCAVRVVGEGGDVLREGVQGEVQVRGAAVSAGYLDDAAATAEVMGPDGWLRTGDLGLLRGGRLVVTGRRKDVVFVHGRNLLAPDLERVVAAVEGVAPERVAVFGSTGTTRSGEGLERLVVALHVRRGHEPAAVAAAVAARLGEAARFPVHAVLDLPGGAFPRTTSGKVQRHALRRAFEAGELDARRVFLRAATAELAEAPAAASGAPDLEEVRALWARVLGVAPAAVDPDATFFAQGGDSLGAVEVHTLLEARCGRLLDQRVLVEGRTPRAMAAYVSRTCLNELFLPPPADGSRAGRSPIATPGEGRGGGARSIAASAASQGDRSIAIVAVACRFAGAPDPDALWDLLREGRCSVGPVPAARWSADALHDPKGGPGKTVCATGSFLPDVRGFDPEPFGLSPEEAREVDPQQRLFLELAHEVLGAVSDRARRVGVFAGVGGNQYLQPRGLDPRRIGPLSAQTNLAFMTAARVARVLGLTGPAFTVDAACATSLVAVHLACQSLRAGECEVAIAGGVELLLTEAPYLLFSQAGVLSPRGRCEPFGAAADGFVPGEGGGAVLLKPLSAALRDGDPVLAVLRGGAVNNDGGSLGGYAPNPAGQRAVLEEAYARAGVDPATLGYVEAHGTGTPVGDPVEVRALAQVVGPAGRVGLGSIKSNLGHLLNAAGVAALIKVVLALRHGELPPTLGAETPHPDLRLEGSGLELVRALRPWPRLTVSTPRRAGVSAFGIGGTNCHLVLEEAPPPPAPPPARDAQLLALGAPSPGALSRVARAHAAALASGDLSTCVASGDLSTCVASGDLAGLCAVAATRAGRAARRAALVARDAPDAVRQLEALASAPAAGPPPSAPRVAWVFPGPGSHHAGMGAHLRAEPAFAHALAECERLLRGRLGAPLEALLDGTAPGLDRIEVTQPVLFAFEYALARWLAHLGLTPDLVLGHSAGEYVAATIAGALDLEVALELVLARGRAMATAPKGSMAAVFAPAERVRAALDRAGLGDRVDLAAENEPEQVVVSGDAEAVTALLAALEAGGVQSKPLAIDCAAHSPLMEPARVAFAPALRGLVTCAPRVPLVSTRTGAPLTTLDAAHWDLHLRAPVRFEAAVRAARAAGAALFLEVGPSAALSASMSRILGDEVPCLPLLRRTVAGWAPTLEAVGRLFELGLPVDLARLEGARRRTTPVRAPAYPWARRDLWIEAPPREATRAARESALDLERVPAAADHRVHGRPVAPAALLFDLVLAELRAGPCALEHVVIGRPLTPTDGGSATRLVRVRRARRHDTPTVVLESQPVPAGGGGPEEHLSADLAAAPPAAPARSLEALRARCRDPVDPVRLYAHLEAAGLAYGPSMRAVVGLLRGPGIEPAQEVLARLEPPGIEHAHGRLHPALVDGALQSVAALVIDAPATRGATFLGFAARRVTAHAAVDRGCWAHVRLRSTPTADVQVLRADVELLDDEGRPLLTLEDVGLKRFAGWAQPRFFAVEWAPAPLTAARRAPPSRASTLVVGPATPLRAAVQRRLEAAGAVAPVVLPPQDPAGREALARRLAPRDGAEAALVLVGARLAEVDALTGALLAVGVRGLHDALLVTDDAAALGFWRVAGREQPGWRCRAVWATAEDLGDAGLAALVTDELGRAPETFLVARKEGARAALSLRPVEPRAGEPALRDRGVYWITGGLGGIGLTLAEALAARTRARLLLTGRRAAPDAGVIARLEAAGGEVLYVQADAADRAALAAARAEAIARWGRLDGVVHAAGVLDDAPLGGRTPERTRAVLAPKVEGAQALVDVTAEDDLDWIAFCSSVAALHGVPGQADYAAGNAFMDGLARRLERGRTRVVAIDWGPWRGVGMVLDAAYQRGFAAQGLRPFSPHAGARAFFQALDLSARQVVAVDLEAGVEAELVARFNRPAGVAAPRAPSSGAGGQLRGFLVEALSRALRCRPDDVDPTAPFARLGLDSLMAVGLVHALERRYHVALYPTLLFEHATLDALVAHLEPTLGAAKVPEAAPAAPAAAPPASTTRALIVVPGVGLEPADVPAAPCGPGEVALEVRAAGVNFIDLLAVAGHHPTIREASFVPGHEVAGVVREVGPGVDGLVPGDRVAALVTRGGYAERVVAPAAAVLRLPPGWSFADGAAVVVAGLTAVACVETKGRVRRGERVLVQAAAGATGLACVQLALHHGAVVLGTASAPEKLARLRALGVAHPIDYKAAPFDEEVRRLTGGEGVDVIVDSLSGAAIERGLSVLRPGGRFVEIGAAGVVAPPPLDATRLFLADQDFSTVNVARLGEDPARGRATFERLARLLADGVLRPEVGARLPLHRADEAHRLLRERRNLGKVVLMHGDDA